MILAASPLLTTVLSVTAALGYAAVGLVQRRTGPTVTRNGLTLAWLLHALALGSSLLAVPPTFGFGPALSVTAWLVLLVYAVESHIYPQLKAKAALLGLGMVAVPVAAATAANVRIAADGINYSSIAYTTTNAQGQFTLQLPTSSRSAVQGRRGAFLTNATAVDVQSAPISLLTCLTIPTTNAATMRLTWGASPSDIDSHLRVPGGAHVYYASQGSLSAEPNASLDVDDVTGFGPEVTTIRKPKVGIYRFYLHNFSQTFAPGMTGSPTRVELNYVGRTVVFSPPSGEGSALWWHLFDLEVQADCSMVLYRYNRWSADEPQNPNPAGTASECVPR